MSDVIIIVEAPQGFNDFSILKESVKVGGRVEVTEAQFLQMRQSDPTIVAAERRLPIDSEAAKKLAAEQAVKDAEKEAILAKHAKDAPPRRKGKGRKQRPPNPKVGVSEADMVHLPVTKDE